MYELESKIIKRVPFGGCVYIVSEPPETLELNIDQQGKNFLKENTNKDSIYKIEYIFYDTERKQLHTETAIKIGTVSIGKCNFPYDWSIDLQSELCMVLKDAKYVDITIHVFDSTKVASSIENSETYKNKKRKLLC